MVDTGEKSRLDGIGFGRQNLVGEIHALPFVHHLGKQREAGQTDGGFCVLGLDTVDVFRFLGQKATGRITEGGGTHTGFQGTRLIKLAANGCQTTDGTVVVETVGTMGKASAGAEGGGRTLGKHLGHGNDISGRDAGNLLGGLQIKAHDIVLILLKAVDVLFYKLLIVQIVLN